MASYMKYMLLAAASMVLASCGGGGGDGAGFLPDQGATSDLEITTTALDPVAQLPYSAVLEVAGGVAPYEWTLVNDGGTGFTLDSLGVLRADTAAVEGTYGLSFRVEDAQGTTVDKSITLEVSVTPLSIVTTALPDAAEGGVYSTILEADGGSEPYSWLLLDDGGTEFTLSSTGILSGSGKNAGGYGVTISLTDALGDSVERSFVLTITGDEPTPLSIVTNTLPSASQSSVYAATLVASGGSGDYSWNLVDNGGTGLALSANGLLSGRAPSVVGVWGITVEVTDGVSTAIASMTLTVTTVDAAPVVINTGALPNGNVGIPYAAVVSASGGSGQYSWSLIDDGGTGLTLTSGGVLSGSFSDAGDYGLTVRAFDGFTTSTGSLSVSVGSFDDEFQVLSIQTSSLPEATSGAPYAVVLTASGGSAPYTWSLLDANGSGLTLSPIGLLSGTAPATGIYSLVVSVESGSVTVPRLLNLSVN